jgi:hypothetical protein
MTEALVAHDPALAVPMKPEQLQARLKLIQDVMRTVMRRDEDYGTIPGTDKPTLYKPGAEKILVTLRLTAAEPIVEDLGSPDEVRYRVKVPIETTTGVSLGMGIGECSSNEEKYKWRRPVWESKEFEETPADRRREVWKKVKGRAQKIKQVRTEPADVANTILKMAHKRALVHGTLLATAAGSVFGQDLEDLPEEVRENLTDDRPSAPQEPQRVANGGTTQKPATSTPPASAATSKPSTSAAPAPPAADEVWTGARILTTKFVPDDAGGFYEITTSRGVMVTREKARYEEAATCEGADTLLKLTWKWGKRTKLGGAQERIVILLKLELDEAPQQGELPTGEGSDAVS